MSQFNILVVDDERHACAALVGMLKLCGYAASFALCGKDALEMYKSDDYDFNLALVDFNMPGMNGLELCSELKAHKDVPVFLCSGSIEDIRVSGGDLKKVNELFCKPLEFNLINNSIKRYLM